VESWDVVVAVVCKFLCDLRTHAHAALSKFGFALHFLDGNMCMCNSVRAPRQLPHATGSAVLSNLPFSFSLWFSRTFSPSNLWGVLMCYFRCRPAAVKQEKPSSPRGDEQPAAPPRRAACNFYGIKPSTDSPKAPNRRAMSTLVTLIAEPALIKKICQKSFFGSQLSPPFFFLSQKSNHLLLHFTVVVATLIYILHCNNPL